MLITYSIQVASRNDDEEWCSGATLQNLNDHHDREKKSLNDNLRYIPI